MFEYVRRNQIHRVFSLIFKRLLNYCFFFLTFYYENFIDPGWQNFADFTSGSEGKESACNAGGTRDMGSAPELGKSPAERNGNPLWYSSLENPLDRGVWCTSVHGVTKSWTWLRSYSRKTSAYALLTMPKPLTVWITANCRKFFKRQEC